MIKHNAFCIERSISDQTICASVHRLDQGISVLLTGGRSHVGSVSLMEKPGIVRTLECVGHQDAKVSEKWASILCRYTKEPACVVCGIHYDDLSRLKLQNILENLDDMLLEILNHLKPQ